MALTRPRSYQLLDSDIKASCRAATAANVTLSGGAPDVLDSVVNLVVGDRVLVKDQSTGSQNGIYVVQTVGTGSNGTWVRASDFNATNKISSGIIVYIEEGTVYGDRVYSLTTDNPITLGSTSLAWSLISGAGGGTTPGGSTGYVQYNSSSLFAGSANFTFDGSNVDLAGYIDAANLRVGTSGNTISSTDTNGNILLTPNGTGVILANANVTAPVFISNVGPGTAPFTVTSTTQVANLNVATAGTAGSATTAGTVTTAAQPNITSVGNLTIANISNIQINNNTVAAADTNGNLSLNSNGTGKVFISTLDSGGGRLVLSGTSGSVTDSSFFTYTSNSLLVNGNVTASTLVSNIAIGTAPLTVTSTTQVANLNVATAGTAGTVTTAAQPNITSVGNLTIANIDNIQIDGNAISSTNLNGNIDISPNGTGNINLNDPVQVTSTVQATQFISNIAIGTAPLVVTSTTQVANLNVATAGSSTTAGSATTAGTVTTAAQGNITSVGTLTGLTVSGSIVPNANGTIQLGGTSARWSNIWGLSSSAQYADLAENYESDAHYDPATVVVFGGDMEITTSTITHDPKVAGVISTQPAYLMNDDSSRSGTWLPVALQGRVPCKVKGPVSKGDIVVTSDIPGVAEKINKILYEPGSVIGKSLEHHLGTDIKIIEVVVGRF